MLKILALTFLGLCTHKVFAQSLQLVIPIGHTKEVVAAKYSPNGKIIATASDDFTVKVWDSQSGKLLHSLQGHTKEITRIDFSPDGKSIVSGSWDNTAKIWEVISGRLLHTLKHDYWAADVHFSADGNKILTASNDGAVRIWNAGDGKLALESKNHKEGVYTAVFSPDGSTFLSASADMTAKVWSTLTGKMIFDLTGHKKEVSMANYSPDGKKIVTASEDKTAKIWDVATGKILFTLTVSKIGASSFARFSPDNNKLVLSTSYNYSPTVWDVNTGKLLFTLNGHTSDIGNVDFSPDGNKLISVSYDNTIRVWNAVTGIQEQILSEHINAVTDFSYSPDGQQIVTASADFTAKTWSINDYKLLNSLEGYTMQVIGTEFSPSGETLLTATDGAYIRTWETSSGKLLKLFQGGQGTLNSAHFSQEGTNIVVASCNVAQLWDAQKGELLKNFSGNNSCVISAEVSPDKKSLLTTLFWNETPKVWDIASAKVLFHLTGHKSKYGVDIATYSPDGTKILTASTGPVSDLTAKIWDAATGKILFTLQGHQFEIRAATFFPDGKKIFTAAADNTANVWDVATGKLLYTVEGYTQYPNGIKFSPDSKLILMASGNNIARVWDAESGKIKHTLEGHTESVTAALFFPDGKNMLTTADDNTVKIWDIEAGKEIRTINLGNNTFFKNVSFENNQIICSRNSEIIFFDLQTGNQIYSLISLKTDDYVIKIPEGYYMSTQGGVKLLHYITPTAGIVTFEQLDVKYNRPDKVLEAIGSKDTALIKSYRQAWEKRIKKLGIDTTAFRGGNSVPENDFANRDQIRYDQKNGKLELHITGKDLAYKLDRFNIWVNEAPIFGQRGISLRKKNKNSFDSTITIDLSQGENKIETSISNVNGTESYRMPLIVNYNPAIKQKEKTYFIGIGIDKFMDAKHNLKYSAKDIRDLVDSLKNKYGNNITIDTLFNENVSISNVKALKLKLLQTGVNDKVIISYSGHGMLSKDFDYYLSTYSVNFENPEQNGLPYDELENLLDSIPARKKLLLIDACHSGEVDKEEMEKIKNFAADTSKTNGAKGVTPLFTTGSKKLGMKNSFELMQQLFVNVGRSTGATVISAAGGTQFALERGDLKNGVFTYAILEFMKDHPTATIAALKTYVNKRVPELTKGMQVPTSRTETNTVNWNVW
jgi:WD40 repeat protein